MLALTFTVTSRSLLGTGKGGEGGSCNKNNLFDKAPQQQLYELLAMHKSRNIIEHASKVLFK